MEDVSAEAVNDGLDPNRAEQKQNVKPRDQWDDFDRHLIAGRAGMPGVRTKEEYYHHFAEAGLEIVEEVEWGAFWAEHVWKRAQAMIDSGKYENTGMESHFYQYAIISPQLI